MAAETHWFNITALTGKEQLDPLEDWLWQQGAVSVTVEDAADNPIYEPPPGTQPVWEDVVVTGLFEAGVRPEEIVSGLEAEGFSGVLLHKLENRVWEREWLERFKPMQFGHQLWVCPSGFEPPEGIVIKMDPGLAFGTGTHATTRLCLEYLDGLEVGGWHVLDYGCGSGVLGIGAALKGAETVQAVDIDQQALNAALENARRNGVSLDVSMPGKALKTADLVFANILAGPLEELAPMLIDATADGGLLVLSGIMSSQKEWLTAVYETQVDLIDEAQLDGWIRLVWRR